MRTGGGYHAYYSYAGERRLIRPYHEKPVDILGGGFVVAAPSISQKGRYQIIAGTLDDLTNLPPIHVVLDDLRAEARIPEGRRNNSLFRFALQQVRHCDSYDALLDVMRTRNMDCEPPLAEDVIISAARSAWRYEQEGRNLIGRGRSVLMPHSLVDELIGESQDAFVLFTLLQRHHWGRDFARPQPTDASRRGPKRRKLWTVRYELDQQLHWRADRQCIPHIRHEVRP